MKYIIAILLTLTLQSYAQNTRLLYSVAQSNTKTYIDSTGVGIQFYDELYQGPYIHEHFSGNSLKNITYFSSHTKGVKYYIGDTVVRNDIDFDVKQKSGVPRLLYGKKDFVTEESEHETFTVNLRNECHAILQTSLPYTPGYYQFEVMIMFHEIEYDQFFAKKYIGQRLKIVYVTVGSGYRESRIYMPADIPFDGHLYELSMSADSYIEVGGSR